MFGFIKKWFFTAIMFFDCNARKCISINNEECKIRPEIININSNEPLFYLYNVRRSKSGGSCNIVNNPYARLYVPDVVKNMNVKVFNLMSRTNKTKHTKWHKTCKCQCRLDATVCNNKQRWNKDKCRCECKELIDKGICNEGFIWKPSNCNCECDKSCDVWEYVDYKNCKCRNKLVEKLVEECSENSDGNEIIYNKTLNDYRNVCNSCAIFIVLFVIAFLMIMNSSSAFIYNSIYLVLLILIRALKQWNI